MNQVHIVVHTRIESGTEDVFDIVDVYSNILKATSRLKQLEESINVEENESNGVEESYYIVDKNAID